MIDSVKAFATAENNHLRIRWGDSTGATPSGEALRILEIENLESRESDIPYFKEWESTRYNIDRTILEKHNVGNFGEDYSVDFGEVSYPMSVEKKKKTVEQELKYLDWKLANGIMTKRDLLLYFNPDMSDEELAMKMGEVQEERQQEREAQQPAQPVFEGLRNLGKTSS